MKHKISVVINTLNEEKNLPYALRSVSAWADEIIVVDMYSDDHTVEIAKEYGAKVFLHERIAAFDGARQFAIEQASNEWVLLLDADEIVPEPLSRILIDIVSANEADVVVIPWLNFLLGAPLMHTGWGPDQDRHSRLFKKNKLITSPMIHEFLKPTDEAKILELKYAKNVAVFHFSYRDTTHFIEKLNRYTTVEALQAYERGERASYVNVIYQAIKEFLIRYFWKKGYRDGWRGFYLSGLMALYQWTTLAKLKELYFINEHGEASDRYKAAAEEIITEYKKHDML